MAESFTIGPHGGANWPTPCGPGVFQAPRIAAANVKSAAIYPIAHGIDLVNVARIERMVSQHGERFLTRVFTAREQGYCGAYREPAERLAGRFAAKEAVLKALGTGWRGGIEWTDIETLPDAQGRPLVTLSGESARLAAGLGIVHWLLSISHTHDHAAASAIGLGARSATP